MTDGDFNVGGSDVFVEQTSRSWFGRIGGAMKSIVFGLVLIIAAAALLFWNEGRAAKTAAALAEGAGLVVSLDAGSLDPAREGRLVHISGPVKLGAPVADAQFGFHADALGLYRTLEMYQWKEDKRTETTKRVGGGEDVVTRYSYTREWSERAIDSGPFREPEGHRNPPLPGVRSHTFFPADAKLGAFSLGANVLGEISAREPFAPPSEALAAARAALGSKAQIASGGVYVGADPDRPQAGDVRVTWRVAPVGDLSVVGAQVRNAISPYRTRNGQDLLLVEVGDVDAHAMFAHGEEENSVLTWVLRAVGAVVMLIGFRVAMDLIEVLADFMPLLGSIVGAGVTLVAFFCTLLLAPLIIAIAWLAYRPLVALGALVVGAALAYLVHALARRRVAPTPRPV